MSCRDFSPTLEKFCADPKDFESERQINEMATFFGMKGSELKKVKRMASREESARLDIQPNRLLRPAFRV
jgi:hypothetical protein